MARELVLIIEDRRENIVFLANQILRPNGYQVIIAADGQSGLEKALAENPDLIITDYRMPRMTGIEMLRELNKAGRHIPTILTTFHGSEEIAIEAFRLGACDYLIKPYEVQDMLNAIDRALSTKRRFVEEKSALQADAAQAKTQLERQVKEMQILWGIGKAVTSLLNLEKVLQRIVQAAIFLTNAEESFLMLVDPESGELYMRAVQGMGKKYTRFRQKVDDSMAGQVVRTGMPVRVGRAKDAKTHEVMTGYLVRNLLNVPLKVRDTVIGVLGVDHITDRDAFTENHEYLLSALADYAAIAIDNSRLYELMDRRAQELTRLVTTRRETDRSAEIASLQEQLAACQEHLQQERAQWARLVEQLGQLSEQARTVLASAPNGTPPA